MKSRSFIADVVTVLQSNVTGLIFTFVTGVVIARILGPEGKGLISFLMVYPTLVISLADMGIRQSTVYFTGNGIFQTEEIVGAVSGLFLITSSLCVSIVAGLLLASETDGVSVAMLFLCLAIIPLRLFQSYCRGLLLGKQEVRSYSRMLWFPAVLTALFTLLFVAFLELGVFGALLAPICSLIPIVAWGGIFLSKKYSLVPSFNLGIMKKITAMGLLFSVTLFVQSLSQRIPIIALASFGGLEQIGLFTVGLAFAEMLSQVPKALGVIVFSRSVGAQDNHAFSQSVGEVFRITLIIGCFFGVAFSVVCELFVTLVYGVEFQMSANVIRALIPGVIAMSAFRMLVMDLAGRGRPIIALWASIPSVLINSVLCFILIEPLGALGAALALSASNIFATVLFTFVYTKYTHISLRDLFEFSVTDFRFINILYSRLYNRFIKR